jgi:hypothetical protein
MEFRIGDPVEGRDDLLGLIQAFSVHRSKWLLNAVLVEPEHRLGMGRWISVTDFEATADERDFTARLASSEFQALPSGESTEIVDGVRTKVPHIPTVPVLRKVAKEIAAPGSVVLNEVTQIGGSDGVEIGRLIGLDTDTVGAIQNVLLGRRRLLRTVEEALPITGLTLKDWGIEAALAGDQ